MYHRDRTNVGATPPASDTATRAVITFSSPGKSVMKLSLQNTGFTTSFCFFLFVSFCSGWTRGVIFP